MAMDTEAARISAVRRFNRFFTQKIGVLHEGLLDSEFSLTEVRVLYEIANRDRATATELRHELGLDAGYLSRILRRFARAGLMRRKAVAADARRQHLFLTAKGRRTFAALDRRSEGDVAALLRGLGEAEKARLLGAMHGIETVLGADVSSAEPSRLRAHRIGDIGWVIQRHGELYAQEYGWDARFEALVAEVAAKFLRDFDPARERCWIAERDGERLGCVFLVKNTDEIAQLRLLLVEPKARGLGIGRRLTRECVSAARQMGYRKMILWTNDVLHAARHLYEEAGFTLAKEEPHAQFGENLVGQYWELEL